MYWENFQAAAPRSADSVLDGTTPLAYLWGMSKAVKAPAPDPAKLDALPFEEALKRLEAIVEAMESEDLPLETLLTRFEEGTRLAKACQEKLADADLKVQKLEKNSAGELTLKPLPPETTDEE
jgi:exodeoxyribonuclease VII small subunit